MALLIAATVVTATALVATPLPAAAGRTTLTAPYARSSTSQWCDLGAVCQTTTVADTPTGNLLTDLLVYGTKAYESRYCPDPPEPTCLIGLRPAGGTGRAIVVATHTLTDPLTSVGFTVTVRTGEAAAQAPPNGSAVAHVWAFASPVSSTCSCSGGTFETVVDSYTKPKAAATNRTMRFTYKNNDGGKIPAGPVDIAVGLTAEAGGEGWSSVRLPATVVSIASTGA